MNTQSATLRRLQLLQLADSALPVGSLGHSFGLETLVQDGSVSVEGLYSYLCDLLEESLVLEAAYCRAAHACDRHRLPLLNERFGALRAARESRQASAALGRRLIRLVADLENLTSPEQEELYFPIAFGYVCGILSIEISETVAAFLHQSLMNTVSAAQRLMPLGQMDASRMLWDLKPAILEAVRRTASINPESAASFAPLPELASMRHPRLTTRLFIS